MDISREKDKITVIDPFRRRVYVLFWEWLSKPVLALDLSSQFIDDMDQAESYAQAIPQGRRGSAQLAKGEEMSQIPSGFSNPVCPECGGKSASFSLLKRKKCFRCEDGLVDFDDLARWAQNNLSIRKRRLFDLACIDYVYQEGELSPPYEGLLDLIRERVEDDGVTPMLTRRRRDVVRLPPQDVMRPLEQALIHASRVDGGWSIHCAMWTMQSYVETQRDRKPLGGEMDAVRYQHVREHFLNLLLDMASPTFSQTVPDGPARAIAAKIYEKGSWDEVPILADALEEWGGPQEAIEHLRKPNWTHVRGCAVVDWILGKT